jgi:hypothetical protein
MPRCPPYHPIHSIPVSSQIWNSIAESSDRSELRRGVALRRAAVFRIEQRKLHVCLDRKDRCRHAGSFRNSSEHRAPCIERRARRGQDRCGSMSPLAGQRGYNLAFDRGGIRR